MRRYSKELFKFYMEKKILQLISRIFLYIKETIKKIKIFFEPVHRSINIIINIIILSLVYFLGVGLTFIIVRIMKKKLIILKPIDRKSYWEDIKDSADNCYQQF